MVAHINTGISLSMYLSIFSHFLPKIAIKRSNFLFKISEFNESGVINTLGRDYVEEYLTSDNLLRVYKENLEVNGYQRVVKRDYDERKFYLINCIYLLAL